MKFRQTSFWRNYVKLYLQYMAVGAAAIPAGALYAYLSARGYGPRWTVLLALVIGCWFARQAWKFVDRTFAEPVPQLMASSNANLNRIMQTQAGVAAYLTLEVYTLHEDVRTGSSTAALYSLPEIDGQYTNGGVAEHHAFAGD